MTLLWLGLATAQGGGGGLYIDLWGGTATSAATGFLTRGGQSTVSAGAYFGPYEGTFRYGPYWKVGIMTRAQQTNTLDSTNDAFLSTGLEIVRGVDLLKIGGFVGAHAGWTWGYRRQSLGEVFAPDTATPVTTTAPVVRGFGGAGYNFFHWLSFQIRFDWGVQFESGRSPSVWGVGTAFAFRIPIYRRPYRGFDEDEA